MPLAADLNSTPPVGAVVGETSFTQGGEGGIRTRGGGFSPRTHLAGEPNRPLWHLPVGGGRGIRTHDGFLHTCFQDRRLKPLGHPSRSRENPSQALGILPYQRTACNDLHLIDTRWKSLSWIRIDSRDLFQDRSFVYFP